MSRPKAQAVIARTSRSQRTRPPIVMPRQLVALEQNGDGTLALRADIPLKPRLWTGVRKLLAKLWSTLLPLIAAALAGRQFLP